jgi:GINS complex subunit 2
VRHSSSDSASNIERRVGIFFAFEPRTVHRMALPVKLQQTFLPSEIFFLAEDEEITIIPRQSMDSVKLVGGTVPKLAAMRRVQVPLWLALLLKKQSRCSIVIPDWLDEENLKKIYDEETSNQREFSSSLPWHWLEIGQALLNGVPDDLATTPSIIRTLLQDIREVRQSKARKGVSELNESHVELTNLGQMEINEMRPFTSLVMDQLRRIRDLADVDEA